MGWRSPKLILMTVLILLSANLAACGGGESGDGSERLNVVTSTSILAALAREVGGERVTVTALIGPGSDPHTFEVTPGDIRTLAGADLVLLNGLELDDFLRDEVESANDDARIVVVTDGIELLESGDAHRDEHDDHDDDHDGEEDHDEHGEFDPHVWQDPLRVKVMVENIASALELVHPDGSEEYASNAAAYQATLDEKHQEIQALVDEIHPDQRKIVTNHDGFAYFADRYGLEVVGTVIPGTSSEADPSAGEIAELIELIERENVNAIFGEALIEPAVAEAIAGDTGVQIIYGLYTDQVGEPGSGAETVHEMLLANATRISEALR